MWMLKIFATNEKNSVKLALRTDEGYEALEDYGKDSENNYKFFFWFLQLQKTFF